MTRTRLSTIGAVALLGLALGVPASATAKPKRITGKLSQPGYTVIALADNGKASSDAAPDGKFDLRPPAGKVTLHLRAPDGSYAGPVTLGKLEHGTRAVVGLKGGAKLGTIAVRADRGYAKVKDPPEAALDTKRLAKAKDGVPVGNGVNFGLVRSKAEGKGSDPDFDGAPNSLDVDDDGDLVLDDYDRSGKPVPFLDTPHPVPFMSLATTMGMNMPPSGTVNVNAGSTDEQIAIMQRIQGQLAVLWGGVDPGSAELDCGALTYCSAGGTGRLGGGTGVVNPAVNPPFPDCCDSDQDGLGSLTHVGPAATQPDFFGMPLFHGATSDELRAGDVLIERATRDGEPVEATRAMGFVFSTHSALAAYDDGQGDSATFTYPHQNSAIPVRPGPSGDVEVRLTFWRPQRPRIEGDPGEGKWMDVGEMNYAAQAVPNPNPSCPLSSYSDLDPNLTPQPDTGIGGPLIGDYLSDAAGDQPSDPANTFSYTLNLTACLASKGQSLSTTEARLFSFVAATPPSPNGTSTGASSSVGFQLLP